MEDGKAPFQNTMAIAECRHCKTTYWRFRRDHPPSGYCSLPHAELGPAKKKPMEPAPPKPDIVLFEYRSHRITEHRDRYFIQDHKCEECDRLEAIYADSMGYWIDHPLVVGAKEKEKIG